MTVVLKNSAKIKPRQHILAFPVSDMSGSYWVRDTNIIRQRAEHKNIDTFLDVLAMSL